MKTKTKTPIQTTTTSADDTSALLLGHATALKIAREVAAYDGNPALGPLGDGAITLPTMRPFAARLHFTRSMEALSNELRVLRGRFDRGRDEAELEPETLTGAVLESLSSYFSCVAEDGAWSAETFGGLRSNLEADLNRGVTVEELAELKALGDDAGATPSRPLHSALPLHIHTQDELMKLQGFKVVGVGIEGADPASISPATERRVKRGIEKFIENATKPTAAAATKPADVAWVTPSCEHYATTKDWEVVFRRAEDEPHVERKVIVHAKTEAEARIQFLEVETERGNSVVVKGARRLREMRAATVLDDVLRAMQQADEMGGVESDDEYVALMERIADEAKRRAAACRANQEVK